MAALKINIWSKQLGAVAWDPERNLGILEFSEGFENNGWDLSPVNMPLEDLQRGQRSFFFPNLGQDTFEGLPGLLADSLPDAFGNEVLRSWARKKGQEVSSLDPLEKLSYVGTRAMGALEFVPQKDTPEPDDVIEVEKLVELSNRILKEKEGFRERLDGEDEQAMANLLRLGSSAGGRRPKALISYNPETGEVRSGQVQAPEGFGYYLIKFDGVNEGGLGDPKGFGRLEYAYYQIARKCGIRMMPSFLYKEGGRAHFMTKRFDRKEDGRKIHMQTLCALSHFDFNMAGAYSYEDAFEEMRALGISYPEMDEFFRRMVFNVIGRNQDDHTKNISFLMDQDGQWELSPAYDMTWSYNPTGEWTYVHQMTINGKRTDINMKDLIDIAERQSIKKPREIIEEVKEAFAEFKTTAIAAGVAESRIKKVIPTLRLTI